MNKKILPSKLVCMNEHEAPYGYRVKLAYARDDNYLFGERLYRPEARLWLHQDLAEIVVRAARKCFEDHGVRFVLYDGLRTVEAQEAMMRTQRVKDNVHWLEEPRLISPPGAGGHPRAMAVDIGLEDEKGALVDMGTVFDFLAEDPSVQNNPAHRAYRHTSRIKKNRAILDESMAFAAAQCAFPLFPLPQEWWDFRFPPKVYEAYAPIHEDDLPAEMRLL